MPNKKIAQWAKANIGFAVGIVAVSAFSSLSLYSHQHSLRQVEWVHHTHEVLFDISNVGRLIDELQSGERGYVIAKTDRFLSLFNMARPKLEPALQDLSDLVKDNPQQTARAYEVTGLARTSLADMERFLTLTREGHASEAAAQIAAGVVKVKVDRIRELLSEMETDEKRLLDWRLSEMRGSAANTKLLLIAGAIITILSLLLAAFLLNRRLQNQLRAERELNQFFNNSLDVFCITDRLGHFLRYNSVMTTLLGYGPQELIGRTIVELVHPDDLGITQEARTRRQAGNPLEGFEHRVRRKDGNFTWVAWHSAFDEENGHVYSVGRDVTERRRLELENTRARLLAQAASQAKSDFLASMSHEIRTPMNAIIGMADVLSETPLTEEQAQYVRVFRSAGNSLLNLINDILDLSRIEAGKIEIQDHLFDPRELVNSIVGLLSLKASQKGLVMEGDVAADLPAQVRGDGDRVRQVLSNLVSNAVKFTPQGHVVVKAENNVRGGQEGILFQVVDTGLGIPEGSKDKIFGKYERASGEANQIQGTGLGLHISRQLTDRMGGNLWFDSTSGKGSRFYCWLPLKKAEGVGTAFSPTPAAEQRPLHILLTDDNEDNRLIVVSYLKKLPHKVTQAENGKKALELFHAGNFDLVLMDLHMPVMDGLTAVKEMREVERAEKRARTPILALTAYSLKEEEEKSISAGCDAHLSKPLKKDTLLRALAEHAGKKA
ncbi:MAG: response regulator [Proteobacteria bacterium]|nr:MAG: response regulator [Pseudomonadota bacterium]